MWKWIEELTVLVSALSGFYGFYALFIKPRRIKTKLREFTLMVIDWYDEIDRNLEQELNMSALNNKESKILWFVRRKLKRYWIRPSAIIIQKWNKEMGYKKAYWDNIELFRKSSRIPQEGMPLDLFFCMLVANFLKFHENYKQKRPECNFAELEMPVKFLKFYMEENGVL